MTISPPSNVKLAGNEPARVLASGIDSLNLAIDVIWENDLFHNQLREMKSSAKAGETVAPIDLCVTGGDFSSFNLQRHGSDGYEWLLSGREATLRIGDWLKPKSRPSIMAELRSETLWHQGPATAVDRLCAMLVGVGANIQMVKVSRVDPCVDLLVPDLTWASSLLQHRVTRAVCAGQYEDRRRLTGLTVGRGDISARLYDKPLEIATKSNKVWMYGIWGLSAVPAGCRIIRVEYQLRREPLKELGINTFLDLMDKGGRLWAYCTGCWLKFQDDPAKHHTQQTTLPWWQAVQHGFKGSQGAVPLVREKAIRVDEKQLLCQIGGLISSFIALRKQGYELNENRVQKLAVHLPVLRHALEEVGLDDEELSERIQKKLAKYRRILDLKYAKGVAVAKDSENRAPALAVV